MEKKIRKLGEGFQGEVWLVKTGNEMQILKTQHITDSDAAIGSVGKSAVWREIEFGDFLKSVKHPDAFMELRSYSIENNCAYKREAPKWLVGKEKKDFEQLNNSTKCVFFRYVPVLDGTIYDLYESINAKYLPKLNRTTWLFSSRRECPELFYKLGYRILLQQLYVLHFLYQYGWIHRDAHPKNWMYKKTGSGNVRLTGLKVGKTDLKINLKCEHQVYLCDYGLIIHKSHPKGATESPKYKYDEVKNKDIYLNIIGIVWFPDDREVEKKFQGQVDWLKLERVIRKFPEAKSVPALSPALTGIASDIQSCVYCHRFRMRFPELFIEALGIKLTPGIKKTVIQYSEAEISQIDFLLANAMKPAKLFQFLLKLC